MRYLSVCSGIEAAAVAWHTLGWTPAAFSEIEAFPRAVLAHHYPTVPLHGDFTTIAGDEFGPIDLLVGGTPCQDFSVAGLRAGIAGERGNLTLEFLRLAERCAPRWIVWENVPGVLSSDGGRALGAFLGGLAELGYGFAYRVLDAQYFGLAQRRERVFVVGCFGDWRRAAAVLFERQSLLRDTPPSREAGERVARPIAAGSPHGSGYRNDVDTADSLIASTGDVSHYLNAGGMGRIDYESETLIAFSVKDHGADAGDISPTLRSGGHDKSHANGGVMPVIAFGWQNSARQGASASASVTPTLDKSKTPAIAGMQVRRLTPRECERLQGFPDDYTLIPYRGKPAADGPRYRALGNSMAVPVMAWIGRRIAMVETLTSHRSTAA